MSLPENVSEKYKRINDYLFAVMNFQSSLSDDHFAVRDVLEFMGNGITEDWEVVRGYLERQNSKPRVASVSDISKD